MSYQDTGSKALTGAVAGGTVGGLPGAIAGGIGYPLLDAIFGSDGPSVDDAMAGKQKAMQQGAAAYGQYRPQAQAMREQALRQQLSAYGGAGRAMGMMYGQEYNPAQYAPDLGKNPYNNQQVMQAPYAPQRTPEQIAAEKAAVKQQAEAAAAVTASAAAPGGTGSLPGAIEGAWNWATGIF